MKRTTFLVLVSIIALAVGTFALVGPAALLASKGVAPSEAGNVWAREVGVALIAIGVAGFLMKDQPDSPTLRAFLIGNAILQVGLFPIEIVAYGNGVINNLAGIVPNSILHVLLASGFGYFALTMRANANEPLGERRPGAERVVP